MPQDWLDDFDTEESYEDYTDEQMLMDELDLEENNMVDQQVRDKAAQQGYITIWG
jgi:hypothetical protein